MSLKKAFSTIKLAVVHTIYEEPPSQEAVQERDSCEKADGDKIVNSQLADANIVPKNSGAEWLRPFFRLRAIRFWLLPCLLLLPGQDVAKSGPPDKEVTLDQTTSRIEFSLAATLHTVNGTFDLKEGFIRIDPDSGKLTGRIVVDVQSGKTGDPERDRRMHQEILESGRFPEAVFLPDRIIDRLALAGESIIGVHGVLRLHGEDHDMTLPVKVSIENGRLSSTSHFSIPYVQWGMKDPSTMLLRVKKAVQVQMRIEGAIR